MNQNGGIHKGGFAVLCHRNGGSESPGILSMHKRKHYFKIFHNEMITSEYKETALYCYWILKLRPLWIDPSNKSSERINEKFALHFPGYHKGIHDLNAGALLL